MCFYSYGQTPPAVRRKRFAPAPGKTTLFFSDGRDVIITAPCEPSRITNSEGRDDDRDEKTAPPNDRHVGAYSLYRGNEFAILRVFESQKSPFTTKIAW